MALSHRLDVGPYYTLINRTMRDLSVIVDGRTFVLRPSENEGIPSAVVPYALRQHPRFGTATDEHGPESLVAVKDITPPDQARMIAPGHEAKGGEIFDRTVFPDERGEVRFERVSMQRGPHEPGPTILSQMERPGDVILGPAD